MKKFSQPIDLVGETLLRVAFVWDYIELDFGSASLTFFSHPLIKMNSFDGKFPDVGSRDALCSLIGKKLLSLQLDDEKELVLTFKPKDTVILPMDIESKMRWGEVLHFYGNDGTGLQVWQ